MVEFTETVPEADRDPDLAHKIKRDEVGSVLAFALAGARDIIEASEDGRWRFLTTARQSDIQAQWELEINSVAAFLEDSDVVAFGEKLDCGKAVFFRAYTRWCQDNNQRPMGRNKFTRELTVNLGKRYEIREGRADNGTRLWTGVGLTDEHQQEAF